MIYNLYIALSERLLLSYQNNLFCNNKNRVLVTYNSKNIDFNKWDIIIELGEPNFNTANGLFKSLIETASLIKKYRKCVDRIEEVTASSKVFLYYPTLEDILCNHLFFNIKNLVSAYVVEEGVLNYYLHTTKHRSLLKKTTKKIISSFFNLKYETNYLGHTTGVDYDIVKSQFVIAPGLAYCKHKSHKFTNIKTVSFVPEQTALIIGQEPYYEILGYRKFKIVMDKFLTIVKHELEKAEIKKIYYKPHRYGPRIKSNLFFKHFSPEGFEILDPNHSIEQLYFDRLRCKNVYTIDSSALFSIFTSLSDETKKMVVLCNFPVSKLTENFFCSFSISLKNGN